MQKIKSVLLSQLDANYASASNIGHVILLKDNFDQQTFTTTGTSGTDLTLGSVANLGNGTIVRLSTTGTLPTGLVTGQDYWIVTAGVGLTEIKLCPSYDDFLANNYSSYTSAGTGVHTLIEQTFTEDYFVRELLTKTALMKKELSHPDYVRKVLNFPDPASFDNENLYAVKRYQTSWEKLDLAVFSFRYVLVMIGSTSTIGDTTGNLDSLHQYPAAKIVNNIQAINLEFING